MLPNIYIHEQSALERLQHQQCEGGQERMLAGLPRHRGLRCPVGLLSRCLAVVRTSLQRRKLPVLSAVCNRTRYRAPGRKDRSMNPQIQAEEQLNRITYTQQDAIEIARLARCGFTAEEALALLWLRHWYQSGGGDRVPLLRHWEFLKQLFIAGKLEV